MRIQNNKSTILAAITVAAMMAGAASVATAGRGGSDSRIRNAANTGSVDAIIAEVERAERLVCSGCIGTVRELLDDARYEVREVAAWWFARRPAQKRQLTERSIARLAGDDPVQARNAADILGAFEDPTAIPALSAAVERQALSAEARAHAVKALGNIGHIAANPALEAAMADSDAGVRLAAVTSWLQIHYQGDAIAVTQLIADADVRVRRKAAAVAGNLREVEAREALEAQLASDQDPAVRRNAAWALGRIGDAASRPVLESAVDDPSSLVRMTAKAALRNLR